MRYDWLSLNLKTSLLVGAASISAVGTTSSIFFNSSEGVIKAVKESTDPVLKPFKDGTSNLLNQLDDFSKHSYNKGIDAKDWVAGNFNKSKIYSGGKNIYGYLKDWSESIYSFAKGFKETAVNFFKNWEDNRETMHVIFKALGNSFSLIGGLMGSMQSEGESTLKLLFEAISHPKFKDFMTEVSTMLSKNPNLMPSIQGDDVTDILSAFRQDADTVHSTLQELNKKKEGEVTREVLLSALKLQSLMGKVSALIGRAKSAIAAGQKDGISELMNEIKQITKQLDDVIAANKDQDSAD
ncbi:hypothetical protein HF1_05470 [Mycoplasma haemofelis str. Langford 1]|uniref:Uncharacterized protein n=1 Tax=Mycoplasma haemofelis (strain Langford 1) TaxID=941640 RepID=E8ZHD4_MYCHL|nr:hypothetical protein [Mycoplasma haemofelis]CBY92555.1 hypothetical protein HF1_05470 [Mycoplasma haemofelis str. Langford 1]